MKAGYRIDPAKRLEHVLRLHAEGYSHREIASVVSDVWNNKSLSVGRVGQLINQEKSRVARLKRVKELSQTQVAWAREKGWVK